jgi:tRNA U34 2-thiouridine synthase MnmA/TrmU
MPKAIALYSGGLDSTLAILVAMREGIEVVAVNFLTGFGCDSRDSALLSNADKFGFKVNSFHLSNAFFEIVKNPKFGHGKNMNPCVDCKALMLKEAKKMMPEHDAEFIITGEVLGQRPMSQRRDTFPVIDRESGLAGYVLRPLSAKLLKPTIAEESGLVDRERLYAFNGRSRKPQMALAKELGLTEYPAPAGGCLLTDPIFSYRLRELMERSPEPSAKELALLRLGRHFRISENIKAIVGRDEQENNAIEGLAEKNDYLFWVEGYGSPMTIIYGDAAEDDINLAASICARYSDAKHLPIIDVTVSRNGLIYTIKIPPADNAVLDKYMVRIF